MSKVINLFSKSNIISNQLQNTNEIIDGEKYTYLKSQKQDLLETFIFNCDRKLEDYNLFQWGLEELSITYQVFPKDLPDEIEKLMNSPLFFLENSKTTTIQLIHNFNNSQTANHLKNQYGLNRSKIISLGYARFFQSFIDAYNNELDEDYKFKLFSRREILYGLMSAPKGQDNQDILQVIDQFPTIEHDNLELLLDFWNQIKYGEDTYLY